MRYVLTRQLAAAGYVVVEADGGRKGIEMAAGNPALILLDVQLPDIHGYDVCQTLKSTPATASIPVLMISATFIGAIDRERGLQSGADGYLYHPVTAPALVSTIDSLLELDSSSGEADAAIPGKVEA